MTLRVVLVLLSCCTLAFHLERSQSKFCPCLSGAFFDTKCSHRYQRAHFISKHSKAAFDTLQSINQVDILHEDIGHENILAGDCGMAIHANPTTKLPKSKNIKR